MRSIGSILFCSFIVFAAGILLLMFPLTPLRAPPVWTVIVEVRNNFGPLYEDGEHWERLILRDSRPIKLPDCATIRVVEVHGQRP